MLFLRYFLVRCVQHLAFSLIRGVSMHESSSYCQDFVFDFWMIVSILQLTVRSAVPIQISLSGNPNQLKTERLENNLRLCGENWLTIFEFSSLMEITKV